MFVDIAAYGDGQSIIGRLSCGNAGADFRGGDHERVKVREMYPGTVSLTIMLSLRNSMMNTMESPAAIRHTMIFIHIIRQEIIINK